MHLGIILAIFAMLAWGVGDFLIQRSTRKIGDWETLFFISLAGSIIFLPFAWKALPQAFSAGPLVWLLVGGGLVLFLASFLEFEALRRGKISVVEPAWSLEIPVAGILALVVLSEKLSLVQVLIIIALLIGLFLVSYRGAVFSKRFFLEKGVIVSILAACTMGAADFFLGWGARETDPWVIFFFASAVSTVGSLIFLIHKRRLGNLVRHVRANPKIIFSTMILDNSAWIAFVISMTLLPIGIATAFSQSSIIIAVLLGLVINKEKLESHQRLGLVLAVAAAVVLGIYMA